MSEKFTPEDKVGEKIPAKYKIEMGHGQATSVFGQAGNSPYSDWEYPATITFEDGSSIQDTFSTTEGAKFWAKKWAEDETERKKHSGYQPPLKK